MADSKDRVKENVRGRFYVDHSCIDCDLCRSVAARNFGRVDDKGYSYVYKQPSTPEEEEMCNEALAHCPVDAIGKDGKTK